MPRVRVKQTIGEKLNREIPVITEGKTKVIRNGKGGKVNPDKFETNVEPNLDLVAAWIRDGLSREQISENLGITVSSLDKYRRKYPEFGALFKKSRQRLDLVHMVNAYERRAEGYTTIERVKEYKVDKDGNETLVKIQERERHIPGDARAMENWINLRMADDPLWGKLRDVMHNGEISVAAEGGIVVIPQKKPLIEDKNGNNMEPTTKTE